MKKRNAMENQELENVTGGSTLDCQGIRCNNCSSCFSEHSQKHKMVGSGCDKQNVYVCPGCGKWIYASGKVYSD